MDKYKGPVCRGCWQLGNNCKICERCIETKPTTLATRTDATPVAVEMVAELQLSAFLAGRGSIRTKDNGRTHESSPGPTMDDYRRMARFALAEGWVDATPVARKQFPILGSRGAKIDLQLVEDHGKQVYSNHYQTVERLAERGGLSWCELHAVLNNRAWQKMDGNTAIAECRAIEARYLGAFNPPATDVAALVEAAKKIMPIRVNDGPDYAEVYFADGTTHSTHAMTMNPQDWLDLSAALAPFTKGQNDDAVR